MIHRRDLLLRRPQEIQSACTSTKPKPIPIDRRSHIRLFGAMLSGHLTYLIEAQQPVVDLSRLAEHLPDEWIERAVEATGAASIRRRRLPAEQVVWLVIALAMYRHGSISEVIDSLDLALPNE